MMQPLVRMTFLPTSARQYNRRHQVITTGYNQENASISNLWKENSPFDSITLLSPILRACDTAESVRGKCVMFGQAKSFTKGQL